VPCLALRENTERPVTVTQGTNMIVGCDPGRIVTEALVILDGKGKARRVPELCPSINSGCCARMDGRQSTF
jgi:UDP-N-acetylglucosamine 2-epimerase (non-hydrolysing)